MKTFRATLVAALVLALALPAISAAVVASDKITQYAGTVAPSGSVSFRVFVRVTKKGDKRHTSRSVGNVAFTVPVTCSNGTYTIARKLNHRVKLFRSFAFLRWPISDTGATVDISGSRFAGTVHVSGDLPIDSTTQGDNCDSGVLSWRASRA